MTPAAALVDRIHALAKRLECEPTTLSRKLLGNGIRLTELANGSTMTLDTFSRVEREVAKLEAELDRKVA